MNLIGQWKEGLNEPLWVMTHLPAEDGLAIYLQRMKIEESFRDLKSLLGLDKMMHNKRHLMEKMVALVLMTYAIGLILGETLRSYLFPGPHRKHKLYSGLFVLLKLKWILPYPKFKQVFSKPCRLSPPLPTLSELLSELRLLLLTFREKIRIMILSDLSNSEQDYY